MSSITFKRKNKGYALMISVAVLAVMTVMVITMTIASNFESIIAKNNMNSMRAEMLMYAGVSKALSEIRYANDGPLYNHIDTLFENWYTSSPSTTTIDLGNGYTGRVTINGIYDCSSMINISDGNPNLSLMLSSLNTYLGSPLSSTDITNIADNAPYETRFQIRSQLSGTAAQVETKFNAIVNYITAQGYIDPYTINPQDVSGTPYETQPRAPININTASKEVLVALFNGLQGEHACPKCGGDGNWAGTPGTSCDGCGGTGDLSISYAEAVAVATHVGDNRPYDDFNEFYLSLLNCPDILDTQADLIMANCNPNTGYSWVRNVGWYEKLGAVGKFVIDLNGDGTANAGDKGLLVNTTDASLSSNGYYEMNIITEIRDPQNNVIATKDNLKAVVKAFDVYKITTQQQFEAGTLSGATSYPENTASGTAAASYDGQLMLSCNARSFPNCDFFTGLRANYDDKMNADAAFGSVALQDVSSNGRKPRLGSVADTSSRGDLWPDGMLAQDIDDNVRPLYSSLNNYDTSWGTFELWIKPMWHGYDSRVYGDDDKDKKLFRLTSGSALPGHTAPNGVPFATMFLWSHNSNCLAMMEWGGGRWDDANTEWDWAGMNFKWGMWYGWPYGGEDWYDHKAGEWIYVTLTWKGPDPIEGTPVGTYNDSVSPMYMYYNSTRKLETKGGAGMSMNNTYYYHNASGDPGNNNYDVSVGHECTQWIGYQAEFSNALIGFCGIWPSALSQNEVNIYYNKGIYGTSGTYTSEEISLDNEVEWGTITWCEAIPNGINGNIVLDADTGSGMTGNWSSPTSYNRIDDTSDEIQIRASLSANAVPLKDTPVLEDIAVTYLDKSKIIFWRMD